MSKSTCRDCDRTVQMVPVGDRLVAVDVEVVEVVHRAPGRAPAAIVGQRLHADLCIGYQREARRERLRQEKQVWARQYQAAPVPAQPPSKRRRRGEL